MVPWRLFESDSNNGPSPGRCNLVSDEVCIYTGLLLMGFLVVIILAKGPTPDINSGPGIDSNIAT